MQTAVRKRAADFCFLGRYPHPGILRKFAREGAAVSCRYSPRIRSPLGVTPERGGRGAAAVPESSGRRRTGGGVPRRTQRGRFRRGGAGKAQCRAARRALPGAGSRSLPSGRRREAGRRRACPREAHKGRVAGATARCGHVCRAAGHGRYTAAFRGRRGEGACRGGGIRRAGRV